MNKLPKITVPAGYCHGQVAPAGFLSTPSDTSSFAYDACSRKSVFQRRNRLISVGSDPPECRQPLGYPLPTLSGSNIRDVPSTVGRESKRSSSPPVLGQSSGEPLPVGMGAKSSFAIKGPCGRGRNPVLVTPALRAEDPGFVPRASIDPTSHAPSLPTQIGQAGFAPIQRQAKRSRPHASTHGREGPRSSRKKQRRITRPQDAGRDTTARTYQEEPLSATFPGTPLVRAAARANITLGSYVPSRYL